MVSTLLCVIFLILAVALVCGLSLLRVFSPVSQPGAIPARENLAARYRPMERLLDGDELSFVASQPGVAPAYVSKLRRERRKIFRAYLNGLRADYARVVFALNTIMLDSAVDRPDLAKAVFQNKILFSKTLLRVEVQLAMHALGVGTVNVGGLIEILESVRVQLRNVGAVQVRVTA